MNERDFDKKDGPYVYGVKHKDINTRMKSRSGGIFSALSDYVIQKNGVIYGCILTDDFRAEHIRAETIEDRNKMRGSKYIQSNLKDTFKNVKEDLEKGRIVLFSGTSCQISGLQSFLSREYNNLICIDIVCHGVPSTKVWKEYIKWQEKKNKVECLEVDFRNKADFGWKAHIETLYCIDKNGKKKKINSEIFKTLYYSHLMLRPSCYKCPYKSIYHPGDITIADYWGIEKAAPGFSDNKGVSLVLINNDKGMEYFDNIIEKIDYRECKIEDSMRPSLERPFEKPKNREEFWDDYEKYEFEKIVRKYGGQNLKSKLKRILKRK